MLTFLRLASCVLGLLATATTSIGATVKNCNASSLFEMHSASLSPSVPSPGQEVSLFLSYSVPGDLVVTEGVTVYQITFNFVPLNPTTNPLCQDIPCPLSGGSYTNTTKSTWPSGVSGSFSSTMRWEGVNGGKGIDGGDTNYLCLQISGKV